MVCEIGSPARKLRPYLTGGDVAATTATDQSRRLGRLGRPKIACALTKATSPQVSASRRLAATASCLYIPRFTTRSIIRFSDVRQSRTLTMDICNEAVMLLAQDPYLEDEQKEALALVLIALAVNKAKARKGVRKARTVWVREWLLQRQHHGWYEKLMKHLEEGDVSSFKNFLSVDPEMFRKLVAHLNPRIQKQDTNYRKALPLV